MKELVVGKATEREMADVQRLSAQEMGIRSQLEGAASALVQHGAQLREWFNVLEKRHGLEHGHMYQVRPNGDIVRIIPDQPPLAGDNHGGKIDGQEGH